LFSPLLTDLIKTIQLQIFCAKSILNHFFLVSSFGLEIDVNYKKIIPPTGFLQKAWSRNGKQSIFYFGLI